MTVNNYNAVHRMSETINLICEFVDEGNIWNLGEIADRIGRHSLKRWQMELKPGDYFVRVCFGEGDDPSVTYARVIEDIPELNEMERKRAEGEHGTFDELMRTVTPIEEGKEYEPTSWPVWEAAYKLSPSQFEFAKEAGFPTRLDDFIGMLLFQERVLERKNNKQLETIQAQNRKEVLAGVS